MAAVLFAGSGMCPVAAQSCAGDCNGDDEVTIDDLIRGVSLALGTSGGECDELDTNDDGLFAINELVAAVGNALDGCGGGEPATREAVVENYADLLHANYSDAVELAEALQEAIETFVAMPSAVTLEAAKQAWLDARPTYLQTEMARFYNGPIDNEDDGPEGLINAWPLDESFIDYVQGQPGAGIINMTQRFPEIDTDLLVELNESENETTISTGWHAIEFLLWGQDLSDDGPGGRPFTDYVTAGTTSNQERRGMYLESAGELLVGHLEQVRDAWAPGVAGNYREEFLSVDVDEALRRLLTGMGTLSGGELTGERLAVAFDTKDPEDEHSCFADNTHVDHRNDEKGIENAFLGRYDSVLGNNVRGPGIYDLVRTVNPDLAEATRAAFIAATTAIFAIPVPFDQAIQGDDQDPGRQAIAASINALNAQTLKIAESAEALGIPISTTLP
jgi:putative iron-regulated protein